MEDAVIPTVEEKDIDGNNDETADWNVTMEREGNYGGNTEKGESTDIPEEWTEVAKKVSRKPTQQEK